MSGWDLIRTRIPEHSLISEQEGRLIFEAELPDGRTRPVTIELHDLDRASASIPVIARRVDYIHRRYNRDWSELFGVILYGQPHATVTETEFETLRAIDGHRTVAEISRQMGQSREAEDVREAIRQLALRGIVDLLTSPIAMGQTRPAVLAQLA